MLAEQDIPWIEYTEEDKKMDDIAIAKLIRKRVIPMSKAISNSSPIIAMSMIGQIHLLDELFDEVFVPGEVYREIVESKSFRTHGQQELKEAEKEVGELKNQQSKNN